MKVSPTASATGPPRHAVLLAARPPSAGCPAAGVLPPSALAAPVSAARGVMAPPALAMLSTV